MTGIGDLPGGTFSSQAEGVSADGSVVVGGSVSASACPSCWEAFRCEDGVMTGLGDLPGRKFNSFALAASTWGRRVVGWSTASTGGEAFVWDADNGMRQLQETLEDDYGLRLTGWTLDTVTDYTPDGSGIVGQGTNPSGNSEGFRAVVPAPEPSVRLQLWTALVSLLALARRRRGDPHAYLAWRSPACHAAPT